jgi:hypothetical protein
MEENKNISFNIQTILKKEINLQTSLSKEIIKSIEEKNSYEFLIEKNENEINSLGWDMSQKEDSLMNDLKIQINDSLRLNCEREIESLKGKLRQLKSSKNQEKILKIKEKINKIKKQLDNLYSSFFLKHNLPKEDTALFNDFVYGEYQKFLERKEFENYRKKAIFPNLISLKELERKRKGNILIKVFNIIEEKKFKAPPYHRYIKFTVEDETKRMDLIVWNEKINYIKMNGVYEINNCYLENYDFEEQITIGKNGGIKNIN